ncbi:tetratricopeptide repeat protein [Marinobacter sp. LQ44]|uniref:tetratricopeptide repeat protein n=1 Tax=unclassified Marinobacter TaxID=83889 RepID=UPI000718C791|nr:tetratricopeptide repeat protein [Marinobacter sp. LQ44]AMQ89795.1 hypothetical protein ASQ50_14415 [Marinobacter sp. LQ44]
MFKTLRFVGLLAISAIVFAEPDQSAQQAMAIGIEQFQQGDYPAARQQFEVARELGYDSPALTYNLAVTYYKTGDYPAAEALFSRLLEGQNQALARYNLGLVALADGRLAVAERWFQESASEDAPETIRELAQRQLAKLAEDAPSDLSSMKSMAQGYLATGLGYDSNVAGVPDDSPSDRGSFFAELVAAGTLIQPVNDDWRVVWDGVIYGQDYTRSRADDTSVLQARAAALRRFDQWELGLRAGASRAWLGNDELETRAGLSLFGRSGVCPLSDWLAGCSWSVSADQVNGGPDYDAYDGQWYQFEARAEQNFDWLLVEGFYRWQRNHRKDFQQDEFFASVSPVHHELGVEAIYPVGPALSVGAEVAVRHSRYDDPHQWFEQGTLITQRRRDVRREFGLMAEYAISRQWLVRNQWLYRNQDSRIDRYDYRRHTYTVSLEGIF